MAIIKSSKKRIKINQRNRRQNLKYLNKIKEAQKKVGDAKGKKEKEEALSKACKAVDKAVKKGVIKENKGNRIKSQLAQEKS